VKLAQTETELIAACESEQQALLERQKAEEKTLLFESLKAQLLVQSAELRRAHADDKAIEGLRYKLASTALRRFMLGRILSIKLQGEQRAHARDNMQAYIFKYKCICICICIYIYIHIHIHIHKYMYVCMCVCVCVCMYVCIHTYV
jgi:hypothetical protein